METASTCLHTNNFIDQLMVHICCNTNCPQVLILYSGRWIGTILWCIMHCRTESSGQRTVFCICTTFFHLKYESVSECVSIFAHINLLWSNKNCKIITKWKMTQEKSYLSVLACVEVNETNASVSVLVFLFRMFCDVDEFSGAAPFSQSSLCWSILMLCSATE